MKKDANKSKIPLIRPHKRDTIPYVKVEQDETKRIPRNKNTKRRLFKMIEVTQNV